MKVSIIVILILLIVLLTAFVIKILYKKNIFNSKSRTLNKLNKNLDRTSNKTLGGVPTTWITSENNANIVDSTIDRIYTNAVQMGKIDLNSLYNSLLNITHSDPMNLVKPIKLQLDEMKKRIDRECSVYTEENLPVIASTHQQFYRAMFAAFQKSRENNEKLDLNGIVSSLPGIVEVCVYMYQVKGIKIEITSLLGSGGYNTIFGCKLEKIEKNNGINEISDSSENSSDSSSDSNENLNKNLNKNSNKNSNENSSSININNSNNSNNSYSVNINNINNSSISNNSDKVDRILHKLTDPYSNYSSKPLALRVYRRPYPLLNEEKSRAKAIRERETLSAYRNLFENNPIILLPYISSLDLEHDDSIGKAPVVWAIVPQMSKITSAMLRDFDIFDSFINTCLELSQKLHSIGYCYGDWKLINFMKYPGTSNIAVTDLDRTAMERTRKTGIVTHTHFSRFVQPGKPPHHMNFACTNENLIGYDNYLMLKDFICAIHYAFKSKYDKERNRESEYYYYVSAMKEPPVVKEVDIIGTYGDMQRRINRMNKMNKMNRNNENNDNNENNPNNSNNENTNVYNDSNNPNNSNNENHESFSSLFESGESKQPDSLLSLNEIMHKWNLNAFTDIRTKYICEYLKRNIHRMIVERYARRRMMNTYDDNEMQMMKRNPNE